MNKIYGIIKFVLCNVVIVFSILIVTLFILDKYNPGVGFLTLDTAKIFVLILAVSGLIYCGISIGEHILCKGNQNKNGK